MTSKKKYELESRIRDGEFGTPTQFLYSAEPEFRLVYDYSAYDHIYSKFIDLKLELKSMMNKRRSVHQQPEVQLNLLTEKYKTPFEKRTFSLFTNKNPSNPDSSSESNRSKKRTVEDIDEEKPTKTKKIKKVSKKKKKVKSKKEDEPEPSSETNPSKKPKLDKLKKTKIESPSLVHLNKLVPKTPMTNRLSHRVLVNSSLKKTVKAKPLTRRAAAAIAAKTKEGHVKKLVEKIESNIQTPHTSKKIAPISSIQKTLSKIKAIRSSIDKRKSVLSMSKLSIKRKSEKQVKTFLNQIILTDSENNRISIHAKSIHDENLINDIIKKSPQLVLAKIPSNLTNNPSISANLVGKFMEKSEKRLSRELVNNTTVLSQYRPVNLKAALSASTIKATPSKPIFGSVGNLTNQNLYANKFTPSKLTRTEIDEKKKAELAAKEIKERERLNELERLKQEKLNEAKKKRDEKLKKVNELKQKQKEDQELKAKEIELRDKQRLENEKSKKLLNSTTSSNTSVLSHIKQSINASAQKKALNPVNLNNGKASVVINKENCNEFVNSFKKSLLMSQQFHKLQKQKTVTLLKSEDKNLEQTYVLNSPVKKAFDSSNYECTPLQPPKLRDEDNYDVSDIRSGDDTDDDEEPSKPIPAWAKEPLLGQKAQDQCLKGINFTRLFKSACNTEINLEMIFKSKRRKFVERSSSANWTTPPVWSTNGLSGEESFMQLRKNC